MRVLRGRASDPESDLAVTRALAESVTDSENRALRIWQPHRTVAFGRRDANRDGYDRARREAENRGYAAVERAVGGHAVGFTGNTVAFALVEPTTEARIGIEARYDHTTAQVAATLQRLGVAVEQGEPPGAFCPGTHSLSSTGKIAGLAQRIHRDVAVISGVLIVSDHAAIADVLAPVYAALDIPFEPDTVGSVSRAGGSDNPEVILKELIDTLAPEPQIEWVRET